MSHICITTEGKVHINKTLKNLKIEDMYAIIKCINTGEAMNRIKMNEFLDENDYLYSELPFNKAWIDICEIVQEVDVELAPKPKKPKKAESKIPVKKSIPTEDILNLADASVPSGVPSVHAVVHAAAPVSASPKKAPKKELTKEILIDTVHTYLDSVNLKEMFAKDIIEILDKTFKL